jgi:hypothetical protein
VKNLDGCFRSLKRNSKDELKKTFTHFNLNNSSRKDAKPQSVEKKGFLINIKIRYQNSVFRNNIRNYKFLDVLAALRGKENLFAVLHCIRNNPG